MSGEHIIDILQNGLSDETKDRIITELKGQQFGEWCKADAAIVEKITKALSEAS